jgi:excisionase family DNA binding protein
MHTDNRSPLLTPREVSELLQVRPRTLEDWRSRRNGPALPFVRLGRAVRYRRADVEALIESSRKNAGGVQ